MIQRIVQQSHQNRTLLCVCYKEKTNLQKICSGVSGFVQTMACCDTASSVSAASAPARRSIEAHPISSAEILFDWGKNMLSYRAKRSYLGPPSEDHLVYKASSLFYAIQGYHVLCYGQDQNRETNWVSLQHKMFLCF